MISMASGSFRQVEVECPFYKYDDGKRRVTCEGIVSDSSVALIFHNRQDYEKQMDVFCCHCFKNCEVYRMLMTEKYDG